MPLNIPTTGTENNVSFGPGRVYMEQYPAAGPVASGSTPTTDVGWIGEDGVNVELTKETSYRVTLSWLLTASVQHKVQ